MERFRLKSATMAVHQIGDERKAVAVIIPAGSEVITSGPIDTRTKFDHAKFITVKWAGSTVQMFLLDLIERGERVDSAGQ